MNVIRLAEQGWVADRLGDRTALWVGFVFYLIGMLMTVYGQSPAMMHWGGGVLVGLGVSGTAFGLILPVVGRAVPEAKRSQALALTAALGSIGQMTMPALSGWLVAAYGWQNALLAMTAMLLPIAFCIPLLKARIPAGLGRVITTANDASMAVHTRPERRESNTERSTEHMC